MQHKTIKNYNKGDYTTFFNKKKKQPQCFDVDAWQKDESDDIEINQRDNFYPVQAVLGRKIQKGKKQYYVKWKNCPGMDTWEPEQNLLFLKEQIQALDEKIDREERIYNKEPSLSIYKVIEERIIKAGGYRNQEEDIQQISQDFSNSNGEFSQSRFSERSTKSKCLFEDSYQDKDASAQNCENKHKLLWRPLEKQIIPQITQEEHNINKTKFDFKFGEYNNQTTNEQKSKSSQIINQYYQVNSYQQLNSDEYLDDAIKQADEIIAEINKNKSHKTIETNKIYATIKNSLRWLGQQQSLITKQSIQNVSKTKPRQIQIK